MSKAKVDITDLRDDPDYTKAVIIVNFVMMVIVPLAVLSICHVYTFR